VPGVLSVAQIGNALRVLNDANGDAAGRVRNALADAGLEAEVSASHPNLEDVFVSSTRGRDDEAVGATTPGKAA